MSQDTAIETRELRKRFGVVSGHRLALTFDVTVKVVLIGLLALGAFSDFQQFEGKAFGWRLAGYSISTVIVPIVWWLVRRPRRSPYPYAVDILFVAPFLIDTIGNALDLYDTVEWWDDANHFVNWGLLSAALGLLLLRRPVTSLTAFGLVTGFGAATAILWEMGEYIAFIHDSPERATAYTYTLGDLTLGLAGSATAALAIAWAAHRRQLK